MSQETPSEFTRSRATRCRVGIGDKGPCEYVVLMLVLVLVVVSGLANHKFEIELICELGSCKLGVQDS